MDTIKHKMLEEADWLLRKMVRKFVKEREKINIEGIMLPGYLILKKIIDDGQQRLTDLAEELDLTSGAITALCDKLEKKGFAVRERKQKDRRIVWLDITDEGRDFVNRNNNIEIHVISVLFDGFSPAEIQLQIHLYKHLINNLENSSNTLMALIEENSDLKAAKDFSLSQDKTD